MKRTIVGTTMLLVMAIGASALTPADKNKSEACCTECKCDSGSCNEKGCAGCCDKDSACCGAEESCCAG